MGDQAELNNRILKELQAIHHRLDSGKSRFESIEKGQAKHAQLIAENTEITQEVADLLEAARGGFRVLGWIGSALKWLGIAAGAVLSIWGLVVAVKSGVPPKP